MRQLLILDWDWTVARGEHTTLESPFRQPGEKYVWMSEDMPELLTYLHDHEDYEIVAATNQGGLSFGIGRMEETQRAIFALLKELDFPVPFLIAPYHERRPLVYPSFWAWRKPYAGMYQLLWQLHPDIEHTQVLVVGDREEDRIAASVWGFEYLDAADFFAEVRAELEHEKSLEINAGEVFEEQEVTSADRGEDESPF